MLYYAKVKPLIMYQGTEADWIQYWTAKRAASQENLPAKSIQRIFFYYTTGTSLKTTGGT